VSSLIIVNPSVAVYPIISAALERIEIVPQNNVIALESKSPKHAVPFETGDSIGLSGWRK
jgi:hypothetical protein